MSRSHHFKSDTYNMQMILHVKMESSVLQHGCLPDSGRRRMVLEPGESYDPVLKGKDRQRPYVTTAACIHSSQTFREETTGYAADVYPLCQVSVHFTLKSDSEVQTCPLLLICHYAFSPSGLWAGCCKSFFLVHVQIAIITTAVRRMSMIITPIYTVPSTS